MQFWTWINLQIFAEKYYCILLDTFKLTWNTLVNIEQSASTRSEGKNKKFWQADFKSHIWITPDTICEHGPVLLNVCFSIDWVNFMSTPNLPPPKKVLTLPVIKREKTCFVQKRRLARRLAGWCSREGAKSSEKRHRVHWHLSLDNLWQLSWVLLQWTFDCSISSLTMDELVLDVEKQYQGGAFLPMIFTDRIYVKL